MYMLLFCFNRIVVSFYTYVMCHVSVYVSVLLYVVHVNSGMEEWIVRMLRV